MQIDPLMTVSPGTGAIRHLTDDLLAEVYLAPFADFDIAAALGARPAPWSDSLDAAPEATARAVEAGLVAVARATSALDPREVGTGGLPDGRMRRHLEALLSLWRDLDALPEPLASRAHVLRSDAALALEPLVLLDPEPCAFADPSERSLRETLIRRHGLAPAPVLKAWRARQPARDGTAPGALGHLQAGLGRNAATTAIDETVACFGLRDPRDEADFAAALCQRLVDDGKVAGPQEIGLLVPEDRAYAIALPEAFDRIGMPLSGGQAQPACRDPAGEVLSLLLAILEGPAPRTALASLMVSPLMPWPRATGRAMAREIMDRGTSRTAKALDGPARAILDALRPAETPNRLFARLGQVAAALPEAGLHPRIGPLRAATTDTLDWRVLHRLAAPAPQDATGHDRFVEGVSLFPERAVPWRPVRQLVVLGLTGRRWPRPPGNDPVFTEGEIAAINAATGLVLPGRRTRIARGIELFRRQLCAATEAVTLLAPACDLRGDRLPVSTGLALIAHALGTEPGRMLRDLRSERPDTWPVRAHLPPAIPGGGAPALPPDGVMHLGSDLLRLREDAEGDRAPQSPSRLETLLVSPLAWLLDELDARDRPWAPEALDVLTLGAIMHRVLEYLFPEGTRSPDPREIASRVADALDRAIARDARWLAAPEWQTERDSLLREAHEVAAAWAAFLTETGAEVLHTEIELQGDPGGLLLRGQADCLLRLPDGRILVVDHKRSRATTRRDWMARGWDLQVALYRAMLERPGAETELTRLAAGGARIVTAYHTLRDATVLTDAQGTGLPGVEPAGEDASVNAMAALACLIKEVGGGTIRLNRADDAKRLQKECGITPYALKDNAFVTAFTMPASEDQE